LNARLPQRFGQREEMRNDERLATAKHDVGHVVARDLACQLHRFIGIRLVGKRLSGADSVQQWRQQGRSRA
jgi:hypothetical protein